MPTKVSEKITQEVVDSVAFNYWGVNGVSRVDLPFSDSAILKAYHARSGNKMFEFPIRRIKAKEVES